MFLFVCVAVWRELKWLTVDVSSAEQWSHCYQHISSYKIQDIDMFDLIESYPGLGLGLSVPKFYQIKGKMYLSVQCMAV